MKEHLKGLAKLRVPAKGLVVDNDEVWQRRFERCISECGLVPELTSTLDEAEEALEREFFHVALVDLSLVGDENRDGLRVVEKIHQELAEGTVAILLTAYGSVEDGAQVTKLGALGALSKRRYDYGEVVTKVRQASEAASQALSEYSVGLNLLAGFGTPEEKHIQETNILGVVRGDYPEADRLAQALLKNLHPLLRPAGNPTASIDRERKLVRGTYWSKRLGRPVAVLMGTIPVVERELALVEDTGDILRYKEHREAAGAVVAVAEPGFASFEREQDPLFRSAGNRKTR